MEIDTHYINQIEIIINIFTIANGKIKILLFRRDEDPFKGYWMLPSNLLMTSETIEECANDTIYEFSGLKDMHLFQCDVMSKIDRLPNDRILANSLIGILDEETITLKREKRKITSEWFDIDTIPKTVYDHNDIIENAIKMLKNKIKNNELLNIFYPSDFTLPELQLVYEQVFNKKLDRRNFRKKMINLKIVEDTGDKNIGKNGRPPKLYRFTNKEQNFLDI
ncbi:MAG: hypothetical protein PHN42_02540 [Bacilli bacterium]|nr:hypothetical protein [Bacilli bacterium]